MKTIKTLLTFALLIGFVDQINNNMALIEIKNQNSEEYIIIDIEKAPCKIKEGDRVVIKNKKRIVKCAK